MKTRLSLIIILSAVIFSPAYGERIIAQPESREIYYNGSNYTEYATVCPDHNFAYIGYNGAPDYNNGALVLAFKLPQIPEGQVITGATFHWFYAERYKYYRVKHDLYVLSSRPASASPVITPETDYYVGIGDAANAMLLKHNVTDAWDAASNNQIINQWRSTDPTSDALTLFLQNQCYNSGAQAGDWFFIRFNQQANITSYLREQIRGPEYSDPNYRPYIEYTLGPAKERMVAQPETREVFWYGEIMETSAEVNGVPDANYNRMTFTKDVNGPYDGALVLAFKLPQLPANKVISSASLKWYYTGYREGRFVDIDLYGIHYKPASTNPVITYDPDYYNDNYYGSPGKDTRDGVVMIEPNTASISHLDPDETGSINQWVSSDIGGHWLAYWLQGQYSAGAVANDWVLLRFNTTSQSTGRVRHDICGPQYYDPNYRPYIEYELADVNEGNWRPILLEEQATITNNGVLTNPPGSLGCFDTGGGVLKNAELIIPFQYPELGTGEYVREVEVTGTWGGRNSGATFDADLYGLPYRSSVSFVNTDYWVGPYAPQAGDVPDINCGTPLESDVFDSSPTSGGQTWSMDPNGSIRAACYINALKTAGATSSDYGFLRFGERFDFYRYERNTITSFDMWIKVGNQTPDCLPAPDTEGACLFYDNPGKLQADVDYDCEVTFKDMATVAERWMQCAAVPSLYCQ